MNEKYFTERLFWLSDTNTLLHTYFAYGQGWHSTEEGYCAGYVERTHEKLMFHYAHRNPELLLQEEG
jgi:hypothetical protein